jgi:hypothetical protein
MLGGARWIRVLQRQPEYERDDCKRGNGGYSDDPALLHESAG